MNKREKVDLLLIIPPFHKRNGSGTIFPLGLGYIISAAKKEGYTYGVINGYSMIDSYAESELNRFTYNLRESLTLYEPALVGIGPCITTQVKALQIIAKCCLDAFGPERVFAGGPLASIDGQEWLFYELLKIQYLVKGDGENAVCEMLRLCQKGHSIAECSCVSRQGYSYYNEVIDINTLDFPERLFLGQNTFSLRRKSAESVLSASMITSRGCRYCCRYCVSGNMKYKNFRKRSSKNIVDEMQYLYDQHKIKDIIFYDDCFFSNPQNIHRDVVDFCNLLIARDLPMTWQMEIRCDAFMRLDEDDLHLLKRAGCRQMNLGIEKTYVAGLNALGKNISLNGLAGQIQHVKSLTGIRVAGTFILGGKGETEVDVRGIIENSAKLNLDFAHYNPLFVYPGTPLYAELFSNEREWVSHVLKDNWLWGEIVYENADLCKEKIVQLTEDAYEYFYKDSPYRYDSMVKDRFHLR